MISFDTETTLFRPGKVAPRLICSSHAWFEDGQLEGRLIDNAKDSVTFFRNALDSGEVIAFANAAYDLAVMGQADPSLLPAIFKALDEGRIFDVLIAEALYAIAHGHLGQMPDGSALRVPGSKRPSRRYSLEMVTWLNLNRADAKEHDVWRLAYGLLDGVPSSRWDRTAAEYPVDDARNTLEVALAQVARAERDESASNLGNLREQVQAAFALHLGACHGLRVDRARVDALAAKVDKQHEDAVKYFQTLGFIRPDGTESQAAIKKAVAEAYKAVEKCDVCGGTGSVDGVTCKVQQAEVATTTQEKVKELVDVIKSVSKALDDTLERFEDENRAFTTRSVVVHSRHLRERMQGLVAAVETVAGSSEDASTKSQAYREMSRTVEEYESRKTASELAYKHSLEVYAEVESVLVESAHAANFKATDLQTAKLHTERAVEAAARAARHSALVAKFAGVACGSRGCDGTGYNLSAAPLLPRTSKLGVSTDRDTLLESGNDDLALYAENEFEKSRTTYVPYLLKGTEVPLTFSPNVLVATGRCSYEGSPLHQMPRAGGERETIRARGAWCGSPYEYVLGSTDYEAGELCTLAQYTYWLFGESKMRDAITQHNSPGVLHSDLAAGILGIPLDDFMRRLKAKDKQAVDFRQLSKPINFGSGGGMGAAKLVLTSRKKNSGFTLSENGLARDAKGQQGYWGVRFCILTGTRKACGEQKIVEYKGRPCAPVCKACVDVVAGELRPAYFRRYPEIKLYFTWVQERIEDGKPAPCYVFDPDTGSKKVARYRATNEFSAYCNNGFQSMLSDVGKLAFYNATREAYLGVKPDGSPSPLKNSRLPIYLHDEPLSELLLDSAHEAGPRIAQLMIEAGQRLAPDVIWKAETAIAFRWAKAMEPVYENGKLVPWDKNK